MQRFVRHLLVCAGLGLAGAASAQIVIGQTAGFTGAVAAGVKETTDGAKLYIDAVNAKGWRERPADRAGVRWTTSSIPKSLQRTLAS